MSSISGINREYIPYIPSLESMDEQSFFSAMYKRAVYLDVKFANWIEQYPYTPIVSGFMAYSDKVLAVTFDVVEEHVCAVEMSDNGRVWEDSCVELFIDNPTGEGYYNFEVNAIGTLLAAFRLSRSKAVHFSSEMLGKVRRFCHFEHKPIDIRKQTTWRVALQIPFSLLGVESMPPELRVNLYKCGDCLLQPHYLSWSPIFLDTPNFHCPEYFGTLIAKYE